MKINKVKHEEKDGVMETFNENFFVHESADNGEIRLKVEA